MEKLSPFDASGKVFEQRVGNADDSTVRGAWEKWERSYSINQARVMRARLARMRRRSSDDDPRDDPRGELYEEVRR